MQTVLLLDDERLEEGREPKDRHRARVLEFCRGYVLARN